MSESAKPMEKAEYEDIGYDDLVKLRDAVPVEQLGATAQLAELNREIAARKFGIVVNCNGKRVIRDRWQTKEKCEAEAQRQGGFGRIAVKDGSTAVYTIEELPIRGS